MKKISKITWILFCSATLLCKSTSAQKGLSLGTSASYLYSYRYLTEPSDGLVFIKEHRDKMESAMSGYCSSLDVLYQFNNNWNLSSGVSLSNPGYQYKNDEVLSGDQIGPSGFSPGQSITEVKTTYRLTRFSIPLLIGYRLPISQNNKHSLFFRLGVNNHFLSSAISSSEATYQNGETKTSTDDISKHYESYSLSAYAGIGYFYQINKHNIGLWFLGDYNITTATKKSYPIHEHPYYGGISLSYFYLFN